MPVTTIFFDLGETLVTNLAENQVRFDDTLDVLKVLQERGYRLGLLSNQSTGTTVAQVTARLSDLRLDRYIEAALRTISTEIAGNVGQEGRRFRNKFGSGITRRRRMELAPICLSRGPANVSWRAPRASAPLPATLDTSFLKEHRP